MPAYQEQYDPDQEIQKALFQKDFRLFKGILELDLCTHHGKNCCLAFAAAAQGCGNFSEVLMKAGAERQYYLDGRLDRAARKGDTFKIDKWVAQGANLHHNNDQPLRAAVFEGQEKSAFYLMLLGCDFNRAVTKEQLEAAREFPNAREILKLSMKLRTQVCALQLEQSC